MTVRFYLKKGDKREFQNIMARVYEGSIIDSHASTGVPVKPEHWDNKIQNVKNVAGFQDYNLITGKLLEVKTAIYHSYKKDFVSGVEINSEWLRGVMYSVFGRPDFEIAKKFDETQIYFYDWAINWIDGAVGEFVKKNGSLFDEEDKKRYSAPLKGFALFQEHTKKRYKFSELTKKVKVQYRDFLHESLLYTRNTTTSTLNKMDFVVRRCQESDRADKVLLQWIYLSNTVSEDSAQTLEDAVFLNEKEINGIYSVKCETEQLEANRDYFIIGLRTGLRFSDYFVNLNLDMIKKGFIHLKTTKTKEEVKISLHPQVREIIYKWKGLPPKLSTNHDFNRDIRSVCEKAGINQTLFGGVSMKGVKLFDGKKAARKVYDHYPKHELVSSHTARRSFATNLKLLGFKDETIMELGGWKSKAQMLHYVKMSGNDASNELAELYNSPTQPLDENKLNKD